MDDLSKYTRFLGQEIVVVIDRPLGRKHPRFDFVYEVNYGFVSDTLAGDGHEIDAYVLGVSEPIRQFKGKCIAVIMRKDDDEHKLVVASAPVSRELIIQQTSFVERYYDTEYILCDQ